MKKNQKIISGIALAILIAFSGSLVLWFFFFREQPPGELPDYPDLTISNYSLEDDSLTVNITNIGDSNSTTVKINVEIDSLALVLYNNSQNPVDIDIFEVFIFSINLSTFESYFNSGTNYTIAIRVDPNDDIEEKLENNNEINVEYYYEKDVQPEFSPFSPNTYSLNSSIDSFGYAVQFNVSQILIENSLIITNGTINGYK